MLIFGFRDAANLVFWPSLLLLPCQPVVFEHSFGFCTCISAEGGFLPPLNNRRPALKTLKVLLEVPTPIKNTTLKI